MKRSAHLQMLRGVAASLVFIVHFTIIERKIKGEPGLTGDWGWVGAISVDLFFCISGYIMVAITRGRFGLPGEARRFVLDRVGRIYPTYWLFSSMLLVVYLVKPTLINSAQGNRVDLIASFLLLPQQLLPLLAVGWTLVHEVYFYAVFACLIACLPERRLPWALAGWAFAAVLVERTLAGRGSAWIDLVSSPLTLEFIAGSVAALLAPRLPRAAGYAVLALGTGWLVTAFTVQPFDLEHLFPSAWARTFVCAVPCSLLILGAILLEQPGPLSAVGSAACWLGDRSYSFYLTHLLVLSVVGRLWAVAPSAGPWLDMTVLATGYGLCALVAAASFRCFERPTMRWVKRTLESRLPRASAVRPAFATDIRKAA